MKSFDYSSKINELMTIKEKRKLLREIHDSKKRLLYSNPKVIMPFIKEKLSDTLLRESYEPLDRHSPIMQYKSDKNDKAYLSLMKEHRSLIERELKSMRMTEENSKKELEQRLERLAKSQEVTNVANIAEIRKMLKIFNAGQLNQSEDLQSDNPIVRDLKVLRSNYLLDGGEDSHIIQEIDIAIKDATRNNYNKSSNNNWAKKRRDLALDRERSYELRDLERQNAELERQLNISRTRDNLFSERRIRSYEMRNDNDKIELLEKQIEELKTRVLDLSQPRYPEQLFHPTTRLPMSRRSAKEIPRNDEKRNIVIILDFIVGIGQHIRSLDIKLSLYNGLDKIEESVTMGPFLVRPSTMTDLDYSVQVDLRHPIINCPASNNVFVLLELYLRTKYSNEHKEECWTKVNLFNSEEELNLGNWQEYFIKGPFQLNISMEELLNIPHYHRTVVHYRLAYYSSSDTARSNTSSRKYEDPVEGPTKPNSSQIYNEPKNIEIYDDNDDAKSDITVDLEERPDLGFQMIRVKNMTIGDGLELAKIRLTVYHTEGLKKGQIVMSSEGPVTCSTSAVRGDFKIACYNLGSQIASFTNVDLSLDCLVYARFYLEGSSNMNEDKNEDNDQNEEILVGWTALNVIKRRNIARKNPGYYTDNLKLLKINKGIHDLPLYEPPAIPPSIVSFDRNGLIVGQKKIGRSKLKFRLFHTQLLNVSSTSSDESSVDEDAENSSESVAWIPIDRTESPLLPYHHDDGFDLYIDSGRLFPDAVTLIKVEGSIVDRYLNHQGPLFSTVTSLHSDIYNPVFKERIEVRAPHLAPSSTLLLKIMTFDREDKNLVVLGYAALNIFVETGSNQQPHFDELGVLVSLNDGGHQVRIYEKEPSMSSPPFTGSWFQRHNVQPIPGASLLLRIYKPPKNIDGRSLNMNEVPKNHQVRLGVIVEAPSYEDGYYYSMSCKPTQGENKIMKAHLLRPKVFLQDLVMSRWAEGLVEAVSLGEVPESSHIFKLFDMFPKNNFNFNHISHYNPSNGFKISIDGALNLPWSGFPMMHIALYPPGAMYMKKPLMAYDPPFFITKLDFQSTHSSPIWIDGWKSFRRRKHNKNLVAILHMHEMKISIVKNDFVFSLENQAWTPLRIFDGPYSVTGCTQMPLFKDSPTLQQLQEIAEKPLQQCLFDNLLTKTITPLQSASVIIRQCDSRRQMEISISAENEQLTLDQSFLPPANIAAYRNIYESNKDVQFNSTIPAGFTVESFQSFLHAKFKSLIYKLYEQDGFILT